MNSLWEVLVPCQMKNYNDGIERPIKTRFHRIWDQKVRDLSGGLTIMHPVKGQWINSSKLLVAERMIPVRIIANKDDIMKIVQMTAKYYNQDAVLAYEISQRVIMYENPKRKSMNQYLF